MELKKPARSVLVGMLLLLTLTLSVSCESTSTPGSADGGEISQTGEQNQNTDGSTDPGKSDNENQNPTTPPVVTEGHYTDQIQVIAASSSCASYSWSGRSRAPAGYIKGMALTYARSYCRLKINPGTALINILSGSAGNSSTDALGLYSSTFSSLGMDINNAGTEPLRSLYTLGIGLGMRESSGKYCEGRDMSASNTSAATAEAGMFQTSYDSMSASAELSKLWAEYKADTSKCFLDVFKAGVSCGSSTIYGSGAGAEYQAFNKSCPAFAAEYAMTMLRVRRNHYGPINRKEAEVTNQCQSMLKAVQDFIDDDPNACADI